jgi:hypothetical protein
MLFRGSEGTPGSEPATSFTSAHPGARDVETREVPEYRANSANPRCLQPGCTDVGNGRQ